MLEQQLTFHQRDLGHGADGTLLHPLVFVALLLALICIFALSRKHVLVPLLCTAFLVPRGQEINLLGQHFYVLRILILASAIRALLGRFKLAGGANNIDIFFLLWACCRCVTGILNGGPSSVAFQTAFGIQAIGGYLLLRCLIKEKEDIALAGKTLAFLTLILGLTMMLEHTEKINLFGLLGGAPLSPEIRAGRARAQAIFGHPILAGCFGGTLFPLFYWLWQSGRAKVWAIIGGAGSSLMVVSAASSTPLLASVAGIGALILWPIRRRMKAVRWGLVLTLAGLALLMKAPVWFLVARVNVVGGSGGYDRAMLIDTFIRHFKDWWLVGTNQNGNWGWDMWDLSNEFVAQGEMGGLISFLCFIGIISSSFSRLGRLRKQLPRHEQWLCWSLGAIMLAHIFAYFGVSYWDQTQLWWYAYLAMVSAVSIPLKRRSIDIPAPAASGDDCSLATWIPITTLLAPCL